MYVPRSCVPIYVALNVFRAALFVDLFYLIFFFYVLEHAVIEWNNCLPIEQVIFSCSWTLYNITVLIEYNIKCHIARETK